MPETAWVKRTPWAAMASRLGVLTLGSPAQPRACPRCWSPRIQMTFGRWGGGAGAANTAPAVAARKSLLRMESSRMVNDPVIVLKSLLGRCWVERLAGRGPPGWSNLVDLEENVRAIALMLAASAAFAQADDARQQLIQELNRIGFAQLKSRKAVQPQITTAASTDEPRRDVRDKLRLMIGSLPEYGKPVEVKT